NLGDDLFIKILCERYPETRFILYAQSEYKNSFNDVKNITVIPSDTLFKRGFNFIFSKLKVNNFLQHLLAKKCDAAVYIGGSLFIQQEEWKEKYNRKRKMKIGDRPF